MSSRFPSSLGIDSSGFTLMEVLISIVLLVVISLAIYQATTTTFRLRDVLSSEGDFYNTVRLSMGIIERDVSLIYTPVLMKPEDTKPPAPADAQDISTIINAEKSEFWGNPTDKTAIRPSRFFGTDTKMSFISLSHIRVYKEAPETEFAKITYELQADRNAAEGAGDKVLVKTESADAFEGDDTKDKLKRTFPLLHGVSKFRYRYYRKDKDQWNTSWDSDGQDTKDLYPDIVELSIEVKNVPRLQFEGTYKFRPEIPLRGLDPSF